MARWCRDAGADELFAYAEAKEGIEAVGCKCLGLCEADVPAIYADGAAIPKATRETIDQLSQDATPKQEKKELNFDDFFEDF